MEFVIEFIKFIEELVLGGGDGLCVEGGDFGCGFRGADGVFGLLGEEGAVALGVGVTLGDGGGDAGGAGVGGGGCDDRRDRVAGVPGAAGAMIGEALGDLLPECKRCVGFRFVRRFVQ
jgi:hypothetical protein